MKPELRDRVVLPIAIPVGSLALIGVFVFFFSRLLLASGKDLAVAIALAAALDILVVCTIIAARPPTPATYRLAAAVGIGVVVAGFLAMSAAGGGEAELAGETAAQEGAAGPEAPPDVRLVASNLAFDKTELSVTSADDVVIELRNTDTQTPHNVAVYRDNSLAETIFKGELFDGVATKTYTFAPPPAGSYYLQCDVHPATMSGTLTVT